MSDLHTSATVAFTDTLAILDAREQRIGLPPLRDQDLSWHAMAQEIRSRLTWALDVDGPPDLDQLAMAGAWLIELWERAYAAHNLRVDSGDDDELDVAA